MDLGIGSKKLVEQEFLSATSTSTSTSSSLSIMNGESEDQMSNKKSCADCRTTKTPLWRGGPSGPKSLCNACGIRYRKKMVSVMRLSKGNEKIKRERTQTHLDDDDGHNTTIGTKTTKRSGSLEVKLNLMALVKKQRCRRKRKLAEEEEAAVLLMALSCGSVFA